LTWHDVFEVIDDARTIGLRSIKFLGPGELFQNPDLFEILDAAEARNLPTSVFTKGAELGDDTLANCVYGHLGIRTAGALVDRLREYSCLRILLGFNSFDPRKQDLMVGSHGVAGHYKVINGLFVKRGVERYTEKRNKALINLVTAGFNRPEKGQRLSLIAAPVGLDQLDEMPQMYIWAARRNIPLVIAPTMESGPKAIGLMNYNKRRDPAHDQLIALYIAVYSRAINEGIMNTDCIRKEGISAYMGTAPCNQVANGLYLRLNGLVQKCPGASDPQSKFGNTHEESIIQIWQKSQNYRDEHVENNWCRAKANGMPLWLQGEILSRLVEQASQAQSACEYD
jgi:MoaA/NifB/PqqE/SkfB family radical SAM enzyme